MEDSTIKRNIKDSVFGDLFGRKKYALELYRSLNPDAGELTEDDITIVTRHLILSNGRYNDLSFLTRTSTIFLMEAQSRWSENIVFRIFQYLSDAFSDYILERYEETSLYSGKKIDLPMPELYVFYTGTDKKDIPDTLSMKDIFWGGKDCGVDVKVKVNTDGKDGDIVSQYKRLR